MTSLCHFPSFVLHVCIDCVAAEIIIKSFNATRVGRLSVSERESFKACKSERKVRVSSRLECFENLFAF